MRCCKKSLAVIGILDTRLAILVERLLCSCINPSLGIHLQMRMALLVVVSHLSSLSVGMIIIEVGMIIIEVFLSMAIKDGETYWTAICDNLVI